jgi:hypothetical protein
MEIIEASFIIPCQVCSTVIDMSPETDLKPCRSKYIETGLKI